MHSLLARPSPPGRTLSERSCHRSGFCARAFLLAGRFARSASEFATEGREIGLARYSNGRLAHSASKSAHATRRRVSASHPVVRSHAQRASKPENWTLVARLLYFPKRNPEHRALSSAHQETDTNDNFRDSSRADLDDRRRTER